jgi:hypothetical protein
MFTLMRAVLVIGVLVYLSPMRQADEPNVVGDLVARAGATLPRLDAGAALWTEPARCGLAEELARMARHGLPAPRDTVQPEDLQPPWREPDARP